MRIHWAIALAIIPALALGQQAGSADPTDLSVLDNSGFEAGIDNWDFTLGWGRMEESKRNEVIEVRSDDPAAGQRYLRVTNREDSGFIGVGQRLRWQANRVYTISWQTRGRAETVGRERGSNRLRITGYAGPEYTGDTPYATDEWTSHTHTVYSDAERDGQFWFWVWPDGVCDIDNLVIREAFWRTSQTSYTPGEQIALILSPPGGMSRSTIAVATGSGEVLREETVTETSGEQRVQLTALPVGYYKVHAETVVRGRTIVDDLWICVIAETGGIEAVRQWQQP